jgi:hypothetical protein
MRVISEPRPCTNVLEDLRCCSTVFGLGARVLGDAPDSVRANAAPEGNETVESKQSMQSIHMSYVNVPA